MNIETRKRNFLEMYKILCKEYGMHIDISFSHFPTDYSLYVDDFVDDNDVDEHVKELEAN